MTPRIERNHVTGLALLAVAIALFGFYILWGLA